MGAKLKIAAKANSRDSTAKVPSRKALGRKEAVLQAAHRVLADQGYTQFSLRNVAAAADMHLSNLQYYFPSRSALIRALMEYVQAGYLAKYAEKFAALPADPLPRFAAMVDYLIEDIHSAETRRFFIQLWALLDSFDGEARLLNEMYSMHLNTISGIIREINPALSRGTLQQRTAMIASMIEGMMLMVADADLYTRSGDESISVAMRRQILHIATDPP
ncbi:MAG: hypothetical protein A3H91_09565 [Gammaproteobacteria bacterium RIFCSPLOWO2_02_FULL_61_13]|nr:MAG: hypothetical protein A3H91_09565 [Gammaproteobacteria bacterium RIFCSPLOWO2_02_FULL_61_13]